LNPNAARRPAPPVEPITEIIVVGSDGRYAGDRDPELLAPAPRVSIALSAPVRGAPDDDGSLSALYRATLPEPEPEPIATPTVDPVPAKQQSKPRSPKVSRAPAAADTPLTEDDPATIEDLGAWTGSREMIPDRRYLVLTRLAPKHFGGIKAAGLLETVCEPIDQTYVRETWGGGDYQISYMVAKGDGDPKRSEFGVFSIPGEPHAYLDGHGELTLFPSPTEDELEARRPVGRRARSRRQDLYDNFDMDSSLAARLRGGRDPNGGQMSGGMFDGFGPQPYGGLAGMGGAGSMGDVIALAEKLKAEPTAQKATEFMQQQAAQASADRQRAVDQLQAMQAGAVEQALAPLRAASESRARQLEDERAAHSKEMDRLRADNLDRIVQIRAEQEVRIRELQAMHAQQMESVHSDRDRTERATKDAALLESQRLRDEVERTRREGVEKIEAIRAEADRNVERVRGDLTTIHSVAQTQIVSRAEGAERALADVRQQATAREQELRSEVRDARAEAEAKLTRIESDYKSQIEKLVAAHKADIAELRADADRREEKARREVGENAGARLDSTKETLTARYEPVVEQLRTEVQRLTSELMAAKSEAQSARTEALALREDGIDRRNPMVQLQEQAKNMAQIRDLFGGGAAAAPAGPADDSFWGKLAHYGPTIADSILKPVLGTVADVTDVARQESARRAQIQAQLAQHRAQTARRPAQVRPVAAPPIATVPAPIIGTTRPQAPITTRSETHAYVDMGEPQIVPQPTRGPIPTRPVASGPGMDEPVVTVQAPAPAAPDASAAQAPTGAEGIPEILTYLQAAINNGRSAQDVAAELRMGVSVGQVPQAMLDEIRRTPVDEVVDGYMGAATVYGLSDLTTPGSETFLRDLYSFLA